MYVRGRNAGGAIFAFCLEAEVKRLQIKEKSRKLDVTGHSEVETCSGDVLQLGAGVYLFVGL